MNFRLLITGFVLLALQSCYYDSEEELYPLSVCDTTEVSYSGDVIPVFETHCYSCHNNSTAASFGENIRLENFEDVAYYAGNGSLYGSVAWIAPWSAMPDYKLDKCSQNRIKAWVDQGMKQN
ncbi:MAG: hypothetical protein KKA07_17305 [Bacteroidetes bacterium]|nr:hypothetical protein [Bacteroidota bacterium]MBU1720827.1 hypothetical protein [Bacteroidota bacterium]